MGNSAKHVVLRMSVQSELTVNAIDGIGSTGTSMKIFARTVPLNLLQGIPATVPV